MPFVVSVGVEGELEDVEDARAQDDGQPLVVGDVLQHGPNYLPPLLEQPLKWDNTVSFNYFEVHISL